jgi:hypothetical protein
MKTTDLSHVTEKLDYIDIAEIFLKVTLNTKTQTPKHITKP